MVEKPFKSISVMNEDYEFIEAARLKWVEKHKANMSMPQFLRYIVAKFETIAD